MKLLPAGAAEWGPITPDPAKESPRSIRIELGIVFAVTLGASGLRALLNLIDAERSAVPLSQQTATIVAPQARADLVDLALQLTTVVSRIAWGLMGLYLLWRAGIALGRYLGLDRTRPGADALRAVGLAALIGIPGLLFYVVAYRAGFNVEVVPAALDGVWWSGPVLVLAAVQNGFLEEVLVVGYLLTRLQQLRVNPWVALAMSAVLRGSYHLYQGWGGFAGNIVMGLVFGYSWMRTRRLWPLIGAHILIDVVAFVGYTLAGDWFNGFLR